MYYKIILNNKANNIAHTIYEKIKDIRSENREWLVNSTNGFIFNHIELPLYDKEYLEKIIYDYGIQKAIEKFILNKKCYETIIELVDNDESKIYLGLAYYIVSEYFEFMSFEYVAA
jgi:hypothetical protein|uniref:Uncharacterized protein n=1 Tax=viral metagenome TaxID=1070528 RepID=A0A6C0CCX0_9ZZZZ